MNSFNYLKANRAYNEFYYQYPKVFIEGTTYKTLSEGAKIAYMLLKARSELAILKNQIDEQGNLYFEFTGKELAEMMNCTERRITAIKKELEQFNLLKQVQMGFNKQTRKNEKNRLYLAELEVTDKDIYSMQTREKNAQTLDASGLENFSTRSEETKNAETLDTSGLENFSTQSKTAETLGTSGLENFSKELNNKYLDTNRHLRDSEKDEAQDQLLLDNFVGFMKDESINCYLSERVLKLIQTFSPTFEIAKQTVRTIQNAKHKAEQNQGVQLVYEELETLGIQTDAKLYNTLLKAYQKQRTEQVKNLQNLIFVYVCNWFEEIVTPAKKAVETREELPEISLVNWLEPVVSQG